MKHAKLSASGSPTWLYCSGSREAQEKYGFTTSIYAEEGTLAHELADFCFKNKIDAGGSKKPEWFHIFPQWKNIPADMPSPVQQYLDYVRSFETKNSLLMLESKVGFSNIVPDGFGTVDSAILDYDEKTCHIFDYKHGQGIEVFSENNTQGQLYCLGILNELEFLCDIEWFEIHIIQPRKSNFSPWRISKKELLKFAEWVKVRAKLALSENAEKTPGDKQCQWCKAKADCKELKAFTERTISAQFENLENLDTKNLTDQQKRRILEGKKLIELFLKSVQESVFNKIINGEKFEGYKVVEGRSNRQWTDEAQERLEEELSDLAWTHNLIGITDAEKLLKKEIVNEITHKPPGKLTLVPESDKRKAFDEVGDQFKNLDKG